jgi:hypothetical protein
MMNLSIPSSVASIFFPVQSPQKIDVISIDCVISDTFSYDSLITDYPLEDGSFTQDNTWLKPFVYGMKGIISDSSFSNVFNFSSFTSAKSPSQDAFDKLLSLRDQKIVFDIVTSLKVYSNMIFTKLEPSRDKNTGKSLSFAAEFKQINKMQSKTVIINTNNNSFKNTANKGERQIEEGKTTPAKRSGLVKVFYPNG